jgi:hypothetical protein
MWFPSVLKISLLSAYPSFDASVLQLKTLAQAWITEARITNSGDISVWIRTNARLNNKFQACVPFSEAFHQ